MRWARARATKYRITFSSAVAAKVIGPRWVWICAMPQTLPLLVRITRTFIKGGWTTNSIAPSGPGSGSPVVAMRSQSIVLVVVVSMMVRSDDVHDARYGARFVHACVRPIRWKVERLALLERALRDAKSLRGIGESELDEPVAVAGEAARDLERRIPRRDDVGTSRARHG